MRNLIIILLVLMYSCVSPTVVESESLFTPCRQASEIVVTTEVCDTMNIMVTDTFYMPDSSYRVFGQMVPVVNYSIDTVPKIDWAWNYWEMNAFLPCGNYISFDTTIVTDTSISVYVSGFLTKYEAGGMLHDFDYDLSGYVNWHTIYKDNDTVVYSVTTIYP